MGAELPTTDTVTLTPSAAARVKVLRTQQGDESLMLRVAVDGGGARER